MGVFLGALVLGGEGKGFFFGWVTYFRGVLSFGVSFGVIFWGFGGGGGDLGTWELGRGRTTCVI